MYVGCHYYSKNSLKVESHSSDGKVIPRAQGLNEALSVDIGVMLIVE